MCWLGNSTVRRSAKVIAEAERAERAAKTARLKSLRMATQSDLNVSFPEELDCSLLVAALIQGESSGQPFNRPNDGFGKGFAFMDRLGTE
jgi:hypothetical protein